MPNVFASLNFPINGYLRKLGKGSQNPYTLLMEQRTLNQNLSLKGKLCVFVPNVVQVIYFGLLVYRNYGLFGNVEIVDIVDH